MTNGQIASALLQLLAPGSEYELSEEPVRDAVIRVCPDRFDEFMVAFQQGFTRLTGRGYDDPEGRMLGHEMIDLTLQELAGMPRPAPVFVGDAG